jgi:hypothetical protein
MRVSSLVVIALLMLGSCKTVDISYTITPTPYSPEFQAKMLRELSLLPKKPCAHDVITKDCSAIRRALMDYHDERNKLREANKHN